MRTEKQSLEGLAVGETYFIKETKAPQGYRIPVNLDGSDKIYEISVASNPMEIYLPVRLIKNISVGG